MFCTAFAECVFYSLFYSEIMDVDESFISTGIDKFMRLLYDKKRIELSEASKQLSIPAKVIEYWSYILESQGLLKINYTLTAVYLEWIGS